MDQDEHLPPKTQRSDAESKAYWAAINARQRALPPLNLPRGVFRFKSFEEADEWKLKMQTQVRNRESEP
jgi:hypothetical protein